MKAIDNKELEQALVLLEQEKGIKKEVLLESIETALVTAYKRNYDSSDNVKVTIDKETNHNHLDFLFVKVGVQSKGIGQSIWKQIEDLYPNTKIWETCTPYFDKRNIHFYVNRLGFHIVEYFNEKHPDPNMQLDCYKEDDGMFRFEKIMKK